MTEEKTYSQMRNEFTERFYKQIVPKIQKYENERKTILVKTICFSILLILASILIMVLNISLRYKGYVEEFDENLGKIACALFVGAFLIFPFFKKKFENKIKEKIMPIVCMCFTDLKWSPNLYGSSSMFKNSFLINDYDNSDYDDIFRGQFKDVNFDIIESEFTKGSGKDKTTIFDGVIIKLDMNKNFTGHTVIKPDTLMHTTPSKTLRHTELEDIQFEKKFDVFTDDEVEARYLITPSFMERLNAMKVAFKADKISCAFYEKYLLVGLSTKKDLFSICSLFKRVDDPKQFFTMFEEILSIIKLIDHFKLNQKIGL